MNTPETAYETPLRARLQICCDELAEMLVSLQNPPEGLSPGAWRIDTLDQWEQNHADAMVETLLEAIRELRRQETIDRIKREWSTITV
jgi:hypothetical protein